MERKTSIIAEEDRQEIFITREFELPLNLLFRAYSEADLVEQWMGNKVLKMESKPHGSYLFETTDKDGNVLFRANGVMHQFIPNHKITRTFEMENSSFPIQLEYLEFTGITSNKSKLIIHILYKSVADRDQMLGMPFEAGINMAHNKLEKIMNKLK